MQDSSNLRRHHGACRYYREDWNVPGALYRCYCLLETPPVTAQEQRKCLAAASGCWRYKSSASYNQASHAGVAKSADAPA